MKTLLCGLLLVLGAVGGIESSTTTEGLLSSCAVLSIGMALMALGSNFAKDNRGR